MSWFKVTLTHNQVSAGEMLKIPEEFQDLYIASGMPQNMALFCSAEPISPDELAILYFSPASATIASALISKYSGVPCEAPKGELPWLAGDKGARSLLK